LRLNSTALPAGVWDMSPPLPDDDPQWKTVNALWQDHYWGRNLDELLSHLTTLKDWYPDRVEPYLWLAQVHYLHARYHSRERSFHYEKAEAYAAQACRMEPRHSLAVKILAVTLLNSRDRQYIFQRYGDLIRSFAPLLFDEALPDMTDLYGWEDFKQLWDERSNIEKAKKAITLMEELALNNPDNVEAQTWASRVNYYAGEYYTSLDEHSIILEKGCNQVCRVVRLGLERVQEPVTGSSQGMVIGNGQNGVRKSFFKELAA